MDQVPQEKLNDYIAVVNASTKKNRVIALKDIPKGSTVLTEKPLIYTVETACISKYCSNCFQPLKRKLRCSRCKFSHYCSKDCQREDYKFHKYICNMKKNIPDLKITTLIHAMAKLLYKMKEDPSIEKTMNELYCYEKKERMDKKQLLFVVMSPILMQLKINMDPTRNAHLMNIIDCNFLRIFNPSSEYFAIGIYINASKIGNDCNPNCMLFYNGNELHIRSIRPIKKNEKITFSYLSCNLPYSERKIRLKNIYNYECQCDRCRKFKDCPELDPMEGIHCSNKKCKNYIHQEFLNPCPECHAKYPEKEKKLIKKMVDGLKLIHRNQDSMGITETIKSINELPMTLSHFKKQYLIPQNYFNIYIHIFQKNKLNEYDRVDKEMLRDIKKFNINIGNKPVCIIRPDSDVEEMPGKNSLEKKVNIDKEDVEIFNLEPFNKNYLSLISRINYITEVFEMAYQETLGMKDGREVITINLNNEKEKFSITINEKQKKYIQETFMKYNLKKVRDTVLDQIELYYGDIETIKNQFLNQLRELNEFF